MSTRFFGQYLLSQGLITADQLLAGVEHQNQKHPRLGQLAVARGAVSGQDAERIHALQTQKDLFFGEAAIKLGLMSPLDVTALLTAQQDRHVHLGQALTDLGYLEPAAMQRALTAFEQAEAGRAAAPALPPAWSGIALAIPMFDLLPRVLVRAWGLTAKPDTPVQTHGHALLSDLNLQVPFRTDVGGSLLLGIPYAAAHRAAVGEDEQHHPSQAELQGTVLQLGAILCHQLTSLLAERGQRMTSEPAALCASQVRVPEHALAVVTPFHTHVGTALAGVIA